MLKFLGAAVVLACTMFPVATADEASQAEMTQIGPMVGDTVPEFTLLGTDRAPLTLAGISGDKGAVLVFSRSLDWCPFCKTQAVDLKTAAAPLAEAGWALNLVTYDDAEILAAFADDRDLTYRLLSDPESAAIDALSLRNTDMRAGSKFDGVPHPGILFLSPDGTVRAFLREEGYRDRPPVERVLETARLLNVSFPD
ncbi:MAG: peroxiredoxin family protein [Pseudomonadota bacterium]